VISAISCGAMQASDDHPPGLLWDRKPYCQQHPFGFALKVPDAVSLQLASPSKTLHSIRSLAHER
jgi:hypothetical protein